MNYVPCHVHTVYSLLDGMIKIPALVRKVKDLGMSACAITDHNLLAGCPEFLENARNAGIKPILAVEGYYTQDRSKITSPIEDRRQVAIDKALDTGAITEQILADVHKGKTPKKTLQEMIDPYMYDTKNYHIILMAQNQTGWKNLVMLQSEAARTGTFNGRFHVDMSLLRQYSEGIICTTACIGSYPAQMILKENEDSVRQYLSDMQEIFGNRFFLEIQPYNDVRQCEVNDYYLKYGSANGIKTVATNDSHWLNKDEYDDHCAMICIATGKKLSDPTRIVYAPEFWLRSYDEMVTAFEEQMVTGKDVISDPKAYRQYYLKALENTNTLAEMVTDDYVLGSKVPLFPVVVPENNETPESSLIKKAARGLKEYLRSHPEYNYEAYKTRLIEELVVIISKGFAPYFLCVEEYINWCKEQGILTGPGRGSAASSLVSFCIGITKIIDPIKYKLIFSRFLTKDRKSAPDIDVDVMWAERGRVIQHLKDVYGADHVAHIGTFSTMGVKSGVKDVCRVLEISFTESNNITAKIDEIDNSPGLTFSVIDSWKDSDPEKWTKFNDLEISHPEVFRLARKFEGMPRQQGIHASGILITPKPVNQLTPIRYDKGIPVTLFTGVQIDEYNLIKLDVLGLKTLDQIQRTIRMIDMSIDDLYRAAKFNDPETWSMINERQTECVFQIESNLMKNLVKTVRPTEFEHLSALVAIG